MGQRQARSTTDERDRIIQFLCDFVRAESPNHYLYRVREHLEGKLSAYRASR